MGGWSCYEILPAPVVEPRGQWKLVIGDQTFTIHIKGEPAKLKRETDEAFDREHVIRIDHDCDDDNDRRDDASDFEAGGG